MRDRKEQIMDVAEDLLQTRSFSSFSYQDVSDRIGISKASIHHHFPSKEKLGLALLRRYRHHIKATLATISRTHATPAAQLDAYFAVVLHSTHRGQRICLTGALQAEYNVIPHSIQQELKALCRVTHTWLSRVLLAARTNRTMQFPGTPEDQATLIQSAIQGALQQARAGGRARLTRVIRQLTRTVDHARS